MWQGSQSPVVAPRSALTPYVDRLNIPPLIRSSSGNQIEITMLEVHQKVHRDLNPTRVWGYNGMWPGPTIAARSGEPLTVKWTNELPVRHFLPVDTSLHGAEDGLPEVRAVVHLHGAQVEPDSDGYPEAWYSPDGKKGPSFAGTSYHYPNHQPAATLWYHDHAIGINRLNIYAGLSGFYLITDEQEQKLKLPTGAYDIPIMIQDRSFNADGALSYPIARGGTHPVWIKEFFGDVNCVNGKVSPFLEVEPRKYRFRILNASNARSYYLALRFVDGDGHPLKEQTNAIPFSQIGTDGGLLPAPVPSYYLVVSPGERFDAIINFEGLKGTNLAMVNDAPILPDSGARSAPREVMLFKITKPLKPYDAQMPEALVSVQALLPGDAVRERFLSLTEIENHHEGYTVISLLGDKRWNEPITERPMAGSTEIWSFVNTTADIHPIHMHLVQFQILNRQAFDVNTYLRSRKVAYTSKPMAPEPNERHAWKDTVKAYPNTITRVIAKFELPVGIRAKTGAALRYVWHCHILEHEDNEMMRPYEVVV
jgi:spore coat protein A, manganese oxidase